MEKGVHCDCSLKLRETTNENLPPGVTFGKTVKGSTTLLFITRLLKKRVNLFESDQF